MPFLTWPSLGSCRLLLADPEGRMPALDSLPLPGVSAQTVRQGRPRPKPPQQKQQRNSSTVPSVAPLERQWPQPPLQSMHLAGKTFDTRLHPQHIDMLCSHLHCRAGAGAAVSWTICILWLWPCKNFLFDYAEGASRCQAIVLPLSCHVPHLDRALAA